MLLVVKHFENTRKKGAGPCPHAPSRKSAWEIENAKILAATSVLMGTILQTEVTKALWFPKKNIELRALFSA